jgi:hypothetical protein
VQVTFLKCGGVVLGTGIHHVTMDGMGAFHFIQTWTGVARGLDTAEACGPLPPFHDRMLLGAQRDLMSPRSFGETAYMRVTKGRGWPLSRAGE